jgi:hypothetical protein
LKPPLGEGGNDLRQLAEFPDHVALCHALGTERDGDVESLLVKELLDLRAHSCIHRTAYNEKLATLEMTQILAEK